MNCEKIMAQFDEHDNKRMMPLKLRIHFLLCPACRAKADRMSLVLNSLNGDYLFEMNKSISQKVMRIVLLSTGRYVNRISYWKWILTGLVIVFSRFAVSYSESHIWLTGYFGQSLELPFNLVLGTLITFYAAFFIYTNLEDLKKRADIR